MMVSWAADDWTFFNLFVLWIVGMVTANDLSLLIPNGSSSSLRILFRRYSRIVSCLSVSGLSNLLYTFLRFFLLVNFEVTWLSIFCVELTAEKFLLSGGTSTSSDMIPKSADRQAGLLMFLLLPTMRFIDYCFFYIYLKEMLPLGTATPMPLFLPSFGCERICAFI